MAERIVSAGVFTNEIDQSLLPAAVGQIGAAIVGPTVKGPAFVPTTVSSFSEYQEIFGGYSADETYVPFAAQEYLRNGNSLTVTRLLPEDGYTSFTSSIAIIAIVTGSMKTAVGAAATSRSFAYVSHILRPTVGINQTASFSQANFTASAASTFGKTSGVLNYTGSFTTNTAVPGITSVNHFLLSGSISLSLNPTDANYITKIFGRSPKSTQYPFYVAHETKLTDLLDTPDEYEFMYSYNSTIHDIQATPINAANFTQSYQAATTPYIISQKTAGNTANNLFRFVTLSHGNVANYDVKVGIRDIRLASEVSDTDGYGTFTVEVRRVNTNNNPYAVYKSNDTDRTPDLIESFRNVNLNPDSPKYIGKVIGDRYESLDANGIIKFNGNFANKSKYIRVEVTNAVQDKAIDKTLVPFGMRELYDPFPLTNKLFTYIALGPVGSVAQPATGSFKSPYFAKTQVVNNSYHKNNFFGYDYNQEYNLNFLSPLPSTGLTTGSYATTSSIGDFYLGEILQDAEAAFPTIVAPYTGSLQSALDANTFSTNVSLNTRKFMVAFQGGFDGTYPNLPKLSGQYTTTTNTFGFDCSTISSSGTKLYKKAFDLLSNSDYYDMNMLVTPGVYDQLHSNVTSYARNLTTDRQDTFYVMDVHTYKYNGTDTSIQDIVDATIDLDNNYTATYWPWVKINNPANNTPLWVPPSVVVPGALTFNDKISAPWYAPAGLNRGGLSGVTGTYTILSQADRGSLYEARVNPIANFPNDGIVVWGQKTLQGRPSALDRVNVRRLLIDVKKFIASATKYLVFEANNSATRDRFLAIVNPYLQSVQERQGLYAFKVSMDSVNNTQDMIDQGIIYGQLFLQPTRTAEFIVLDFNILPTGAAFPE